MGPAAAPSAVGCRAIPRCEAVAAVRTFVARRVPQRAGRGRWLGARALGGRRDRSAALDRVPADAPGHPAAARRPGTHLCRSREGSALREYERITLSELDATERLVAALYATMADPPLFKRLGLLYFAAASFSEAARRLGRPALAPGFLLSRARGLRAGTGRMRWPALEHPSGEPPSSVARSHRSRDRALRYGRPARSLPPGLVSGAGIRSRGLAREARGERAGDRSAARTLRPPGPLFADVFLIQSRDCRAVRERVRSHGFVRCAVPRCCSARCCSARSAVRPVMQRRM